MSAFTAQEWIGPLGGLLCITFGSGCVSGWTLAMKMMGTRIEDLKADLEREREARRALESRVREVEDRYTNGMERQLGQVRTSSYNVISGGHEREQQA